MPVLPDAAAFEIAPDWVCEVLSPATAATDRADKMPIFAAEQVQHLWFIDPVAQTLEAYRLDAERYSVLAVWRSDAVIRVEPFDAIPLELGALWSK
jgi:Uma2 family endonuclease